MEDANSKGVLYKPTKKCLLLYLVCLLLLCLFNGWPRLRSPSNNPSTVQNSSSRNVTILLWHWPFNQCSSLQGDVCWDLYHVPGCRLVDQRSLFSSADVVVFHHRELEQGRQKLPLTLPRPKGQRWAWMSLEAPANNRNLKQFANVFNITISYKRNADVTVPYGEVLAKQAETPVVEDSSLNKESLVCWVVSKYKEWHTRSKVYIKLNATLPVKVYGGWNKKPLSSGDLLPTISRCYFYLAFENSVASDYITEKLWRNAYMAGAVPVVLGPPPSHYKAVAPPHSFIHVDDFASVEELGEHLQQLAQDKKRYSEYFTWKQKWKVTLITDWRERLCKICTLYNTLPQQRVYTDLEAWVKA
ncbi:alpha-(1,3)-fucosyltransferase 7 [Betta splendens]|uniref:Fucosyltransferase n=1 Tax=Betta splendens TaxID=158456 RepID=A0A6P7P5H3_BETSP|nr:alpha-(1,3)-fucosyltransferase 7 [Betta splendens]XP_029025288.1 alpha-(1,3)-fucosyltransferase 7 [Betta splendens]XP_029025289.1 alpha-(1,3)-fucosyltransferase 7 [Betta splendens]XP_029025290.1 alpha-(1,3)-fucosyltransferase 7 [Betta splendens]